MTTTKRRKRKKSVGELLLAGALMLVLGAAGAAARDKPAAATARISGTVFRDTGFALPGAQVEITAQPAPDARTKPKSFKATSDSRGEFAVRVPAGAVGYTVSVRANGFQAQSKSVTVQPDEQVNLFFRLEPAADSTGGKQK